MTTIATRPTIIVAHAHGGGSFHQRSPRAMAGRYPSSASRTPTNHDARRAASGAPWSDTNAVREESESPGRTRRSRPAGPLRQQRTADVTHEGQHHGSTGALGVGPA
jgi:hypothetical protein